MKTLNINSEVRIKLTPSGIRKLRQRHEKLRSKVPSIGRFIPPKADKDGYCEMPLWQIMHIFGEDVNIGLNLPFETEIQIDDAMFKNV